MTVLIDSWGYYTQAGVQGVRERAPALRARMQQEAEMAPLHKAIRAAKREATKITIDAMVKRAAK